MNRCAVLLLLLAPWVARADPIRADLIVEYEGHVTTVDDDCWCRSLDTKAGQPVYGRLVIDTGTAPADSDPDPLGGLYDGALGPNPNFVTGSHSLIPGKELRGPDLFQFNDQHPDDVYEGLTLRDGRGTTLSNDFMQLVLGFGHTFNVDRDFIQGDGLDQSFVAEPDLEHGIAINGFLERRLGSLRYAINFVVDRLSIRPRVCRA
jgi:hypothetical protein